MNTGKFGRKFGQDAWLGVQAESCCNKVKQVQLLHDAPFGGPEVIPRSDISTEATFNFEES